MWLTRPLVLGALISFHLVYSACLSVSYQRAVSFRPCGSFLLQFSTHGVQLRVRVVLGVSCARVHSSVDEKSALLGLINMYLSIKALSHCARCSAKRPRMTDHLAEYARVIIAMPLSSLPMR